MSRQRPVQQQQLRPQEQQFQNHEWLFVYHCKSGSRVSRILTWKSPLQEWLLAVIRTVQTISYTWTLLQCPRLIFQTLLLLQCHHKHAKHQSNVFIENFNAQVNLQRMKSDVSIKTSKLLLNIGGFLKQLQRSW